MQNYKLHLNYIVSNPARDVLIATGPETTLLDLYRAYVQVFLEADLESTSSYCPQDLAIEILNSW